MIRQRDLDALHTPVGEGSVVEPWPRLRKAMGDWRGMLAGWFFVLLIFWS